MAHQNSIAWKWFSWGGVKRATRCEYEKMFRTHSKTPACLGAYKNTDFSSWTASETMKRVCWYQCSRSSWKLKFKVKQTILFVHSFLFKVKSFLTEDIWNACKRSRNIWWATTLAKEKIVSKFCKCWLYSEYEATLCSICNSQEINQRRSLVFLYMKEEKCYVLKELFVQLTVDWRHRLCLS